MTPSVKYDAASDADTSQAITPSADAQEMP
jgi:hypothetical protein